MTGLLATVFGVYFLCAGLGMLLRKGWASEIIDEFENSTALTFSIGALILMASTAVLLHHNIWTGWREIIVSIMVWGAAIKGALILIYPAALFKFARVYIPNDKVTKVWAVAVMALGAALLFL
ncbi:MAG: hypothetical protein HKN36_00905 [Hellea sp.]|nr:hypothetical protein [Hellea sp.]